MKAGILKFIFVFGAVISMQVLSQNSALGSQKSFKLDDLCPANGYTENSAQSIQYLEQAVKAVQCGQNEVAMEYLGAAQHLILKDTDPISVTPRGSCFSKRNCKGENLGTATVEKGTCSAADGKSWRQETPTQGTCVNL